MTVPVHARPITLKFRDNTLRELSFSRRGLVAGRHLYRRAGCVFRHDLVEQTKVLVNVSIGHVLKSHPHHHRAHIRQAVTVDGYKFIEQASHQLHVLQAISRIQTGKTVGHQDLSFRRIKKDVAHAVCAIRHVPCDVRIIPYPAHPFEDRPGFLNDVTFA